MCTLSALKCPLCAKTNFPNIDSLRISLIKAANGPLSCPICQELLLGLDKLTIHLFSHTNVMLTDTTSTETATASFGQIDSKRAIICETVKKTNPSSEVKLEPKDLVSPPALIKRMSKENKTKKTRKFINDQLKIVEKLNLDCSYNAVSPESEIRVNNNIAYNNLSICDICEFTFRDDELLDMHFRLVHQNRSSSHRNFETNGTSSTEPDFKCHLCSKTFKMKGSLRVHLKVVHQMYLPNMSNNNKLSICDRIRQKETQICANGNKKPQYLTPSMDKATDNSNAPILRPSPTEPLQQHQTPTTTQVTNGFPFGTLTLLPPSTVPSNEFLHLVDGAPLNSNVLFVINTNAGALSHQDAETDGGSESKNSVLNGNIDVLDLQQTTITENTKVWKCNECAKTFTTKYFLKKHKRLHTGEMPYTCEICARTFTFQQSYHKHLLYHSNEKPHVCSTCGRAFKELSTLHNHERIHSGEKPFKCEVCGKCFRQRVSFLVHTRIHTGIMPYKCDTCQKSFRYKVSQRTHKCQQLQCTSDSEATSSNSLPEQTADEISENFIKEFLENTKVNIGDTQNSPAGAEIAIINTESNCNGNFDEALLNKSIDDIIVESCKKMGIGTQNMPNSDKTSSLLCSDDCDSPTQKLQNMGLYSPQLKTSKSDDGKNDADNIFPHFLLDEGCNNIL